MAKINVTGFLVFHFNVAAKHCDITVFWLTGPESQKRHPTSEALYGP